MIYNFFLIIHIIISFLLISIVLLQVGKSFGLSGLIGGGSSDAILTVAGGNSFMKKITVILAALFLITSFSLTFLTSKKLNKSLLMDIMPPAPTFPVLGEIERKSDVSLNENVEKDLAKTTNDIDLQK